MATMKTLVDKYAGGYEEWERKNINRIARAANAAGPAIPATAFHDAAAFMTQGPARSGREGVKGTIEPVQSS